MDQPTPDRPDHLKPGPPPPAAPDAAAPADDSLPPPADPALTPAAWFKQNLPFLAIVIGGLFYAWYRFGPEWMLAAGKTALGLGFVIFIHELGHFLAAKWCDVHVLTFSIGFGPALPGCHFQRGETTYKIALLPLGGYVNMVGEGPEADEEEDYPRSFKNKTVGQRMLIISAGVIMNVLFGFLCFVIVYRYNGVERPPALVWRTEAGSRAWEKGVQPGWRITKVGDKQDPWFDDMRVAVALSRGGREVPFVFTDRDGKTIEKGIEPFRDDNNMIPVIGVSQPVKLQMLPKRAERQHAIPVAYDSAAALARAVTLQRGDRVIAATSPLQGGAITPLRVPIGRAAAAVGLAPANALGTAALVLTMGEAPQAMTALDWQELASRMRLAGDRPMDLRLARTGAEWATVPLPPGGFQFDDQIIATTDPATPDEPLNVLALPPDPSRPAGSTAADPFVYRRRMAALAGKPVVLRVQREGGPVDLLVPPAFHRTLGLRMQMGKIAAVREGSPAAQAGLTPEAIAKGLRISAVGLSFDGGATWQALSDGPLDPVRLPGELERRVNAEAGRNLSQVRVKVKVRGPLKHDLGEEHELPPMGWDARYAVGEEAPLAPASPMSIPQLGIAYRVDSTIAAVEPGSPAAAAGLLPGDQVQRLRYREGGKTADEKGWTKWFTMSSKRGKEEPFDQWAHFFWFLQRNDFPTVEVEVVRGGAKLPAVELTAVPDLSWPLADRGELLMSDTRKQQASSLVEAVTFGMNRTWGFIEQIYLNLSSLFSGRISVQSLGGPIEIGAQAFSFAGEDLFTFALFLGIISINLAVVNFLPIPVLDGGHMVFLIYEGLRGKPPSETVRVVATYIGLAMIASLMLFVFYLDIKRRILNM